MTQLMLFDATSFASVTDVAVSRVTEESTEYDTKTPPATTATPRASVPLYDPKQGEIHRLGDLAHLIIARYEMVAQRRRAMEARRRAYVG